MLGYRLIHNYSLLLPRSFCPSCKKNIAPYDLIPVLSWLLLRARCRSCKAKISFLYPLIELLTACAFTLLFLTQPVYYFPAYSLFFAALIIIIRTDAETMLISRYTTLAIIPFGLLASLTGYLPITIYQSILGILFGYGILWTIAKIFTAIRHKEGIGEGDFELLATIGAFSGPVGAWVSLFLGALFGTVIGLALILKGSNMQSTKIAFGPWLALGAILVILFQKHLVFLMPIL